MTFGSTTTVSLVTILIRRCAPPQACVVPAPRAHAPPSPVPPTVNFFAASSSTWFRRVVRTIFALFCSAPWRQIRADILGLHALLAEARHRVNEISAEEVGSSSPHTSPYVPHSLNHSISPSLRSPPPTSLAILSTPARHPSSTRPPSTSSPQLPRRRRRRKRRSRSDYGQIWCEGWTSRCG